MTAKDTWAVTASSGEYTVEAATLLDAYTAFASRHPDDFVHGIIVVPAAPGHEEFPVAWVRKRRGDPHPPEAGRYLP
jgi:hypothetical protein